MKATVLITVYNYGAYLERALRSALSQSLKRSAYEVVVVDDGSTDNTPEVLKKFAKDVVAVRQSNMGLAAACNTGIKAARGEYLVRLDADDELEHEAVETLATALDDHPECALAFADRTEIDVPSGVERAKRLKGLNIYELIAGNIMFRRQCLLDVGLYNRLYWEEHDLIVRLLTKYKACHVERPLYRYYLHGQNMTSSAERRQQGWRELIAKWGMDELRKWGHYEELEEVAKEASET